MKVAEFWLHFLPSLSAFFAFLICLCRFDTLPVLPGCNLGFRRPCSKLLKVFDEFFSLMLSDLIFPNIQIKYRIFKHKVFSPHFFAVNLQRWDMNLIGMFK